MKWGSYGKVDDRNFEVVIYEKDYKELCAWVLRKPNIETGGDLFGLWADEYTAVIQLALGPGAGCKRTSVSFYQDVRYLEKVGSYLTQCEGVCHIGEWHSHHQLGLARPSGGDENTVWNNMPTYKLSRFVIFIANIEASYQSYKVNIGCFLFEIDSKGYQRPVLQGKFKILRSKNPFSRKNGVSAKRNEGAEGKRADDIDLEHLELEERGKSVKTRRSVNNKRNHSLESNNERQQPKEKKSRKPPISGAQAKKNAHKVGSSRSADTEETFSYESSDETKELLQGAHLPQSNPDDSQPANGNFVVEMNVLTTEPTSAREGEDGEEERREGEEAENTTGRRLPWLSPPWSARDACCTVS